MTPAPTAAPSRRNARRVVVFAAMLGLAWLGFRFIEPMLVWNLGWQPLPQPAVDVALQPDAAYVAPEWQALAAPTAARLRDARARLHAPAISAAVSIDGQRVWAVAVGLADVESGRPANLTSRFRLGSSSKAVTSVAIGTLLDAGRLDLELPAKHYIPDLAQPLADITTRQAMSHTGGVRNYGVCWCFPIWEHLNRKAFANVRESLRPFENDALLFAPGSDFAYTSLGYNLTGAVIEAITKRPFPDFVQRAVFDPLGMTHSGGDFANATVSDRVSFYETQDGRYKPAFRVDNSNKWPSGGLLSTPSDMLALGHAVLSDKLLSAATRERLLAPQRLADGRDNPQGYALGWRVSDDKKLLNDTIATRIVSHHGTAVGSTSYFAALPEYGLVLSVMMNKGQENLDAMVPEATALMELFVAELHRREADARRTPGPTG